MSINELTHQHFVTQLLQLNHENECLKTELWKYKSICYCYEMLRNYGNNTEESEDKCELNERILTLKSLKSPVIQLTRLENSNDFNYDDNTTIAQNSNENLETNQTTNFSEESFNVVIENIISVIDEHITDDNGVTCNDQNHVSREKETDYDNECVLSEICSNVDNDDVVIKSESVIMCNETNNEVNANAINFEIITKKEVNSCHQLEDNNVNDNSNTSEQNTVQNNTIETIRLRNSFGECKVCGDKRIASGNRYGVKCCGGCNHFFYDSLKLDNVGYCCLRDGNCLITRKTRNQCKYCRYNKCIAVGMCRQSVGTANVGNSVSNNEKSSELLLLSTDQNNTKGKKRLKKSFGKCKVCGDIAYGIKYGVKCCGGCKNFFYESLKLDNVGYYCLRDGNCLITRETRNQCRYCRYNKCIAVGMCRRSVGSAKVANSVSNNEKSSECKVCKDNALGSYYGAVCCNGCKLFFEKSVRKQKKYSCGGDGNCLISLSTRNACRYCRYKKCMLAGMCADYVVQRSHELPLIYRPNKPQSSGVTADMMSNSNESEIITALNDHEYDTRQMITENNTDQSNRTQLKLRPKFGVNYFIDENSSDGSCVDSDAVIFEDSSQKFTCQHVGCGKVFVSRKNLLTHQKVHTNQTITCTHDGCGNTLKNEIEFKNHLIRNHPELYPEMSWIECTEDGCAFKTKLLFDYNDHYKYHQKLKTNSMLDCLPADNDTSVLELIELDDERGLSIRSRVDVNSRQQINKWKSRLEGCAQKVANNSVSNNENNSEQNTDQNNTKENTKLKKLIGECKVCGDIARKNTYGVKCCGGCIRFFYESLKSDHVGYYCVNDGKCLITRETRTQCRYCRYNKCIAVGMCRQSVGPEIFGESVSKNNKNTESVVSGKYANSERCTEDGCAFKTKLLLDFNDQQKGDQILKAKAMLNGLPADNDRPLPEYIELGDENGLVTSKVNISSRKQTNKWKRRLVGCAQPFKCDQPNCNGFFRTEIGLRQHLTKFHGKFRLRVCGIDGCRYANMRLKRLREHQVIHSSIRRYVCDHDGCGKAFKTNKNLRRHKAIHSNEKRYGCAWPGCEKRFKTNALLFAHTKYHSDVPEYQCDWPECGYGAAKKWNLDKHKSKHTGVQKYACVWPECEYKTANSSNLNTHIKMHNRGAKNFVEKI